MSSARRDWSNHERLPIVAAFPVPLQVGALLFRVLFILVANLWTALRLVATSPITLVRRLLGRRVVVRLDLQGSLPYSAPDGLAKWLSAERTFLQFRKDIQLIKDDARVAGVSFDPAALRTTGARQRDVEALLREVRDSGREVYAHTSMLDATGYRLASVATRLSLAPAGRLYTFARRLEQFYLADAFERFGVRAQFVQLGRFKSAASMFTRAQASPAERAMFTQLERDLSHSFVESVMQNRGTDEAAVRQLFEAPISSRTALRDQLVDEVGFEDQFPLPDGAALAEHRRYAKQRQRRTFRTLRHVHRIAVVDLSGMIADGRIPGRGAMIQAKPVIAMLDALQRNSHVAGVLLCVNSPGGSAIASDEIYGAVWRLCATKPVVAYCQDIAASGGYYIVCAADRIVCQPDSIIGSLGVVAGKMSFGEALGKVGVGFEAFGAAGSEFASVTTALDDATMQRLRDDSRDMYQRFLGRVGAARRFEKRYLHHVARGRVYVGRDAHQRRLVDAIGGFETAVEYLVGLCGGPVELFGVPTQAVSLRRVLLDSALIARPHALDPRAVVKLLQQEPILALYCGGPFMEFVDE